MGCFNDLTIDVFLKICQYLTFTEFFRAFFGLQKRLDDAIRTSSLCINLSKAIDWLNLPSLPPVQCRSLILSGLDLHSFQTMYSRLNFSSLQSLQLIKMNLLTLYSFIVKLPIHQLESIHIGRFTWQYYPKDLYRQIWTSLINALDGNRLRYLHLPYHVRYWNVEELTHAFPALRRASLEYISVQQMLAFFARTPNLRRFKACIDSPHSDLFRHDVILSKLTHLTLILQEEWSWREIQRLLNICPHLKSLTLKLQADQQAKNLLEPTAWQMLIEEKLPHLIFLRLQLDRMIVHPDFKNSSLENRFHYSDYWWERRPYFHVIVKDIERNNAQSIFI